MENDPDVADATDRLLMMQQRLRAAKDVHKKHAERLSALRQRREVRECRAAVMAAAVEAPGGGAGMHSGRRRRRRLRAALARS